MPNWKFKWHHLLLKQNFCFPASSHALTFQSGNILFSQIIAENARIWPILSKKSGNTKWLHWEDGNFRPTVKMWLVDDLKNVWLPTRKIMAWYSKSSTIFLLKMQITSLKNLWIGSLNFDSFWCRQFIGLFFFHDLKAPFYKSF